LPGYQNYRYMQLPSDMARRICISTEWNISNTNV